MGQVVGACALSQCLTHDPAPALSEARIWGAGQGSEGSELLQTLNRIVLRLKGPTHLHFSSSVLLASLELSATPMSAP